MDILSGVYWDFLIENLDLDICKWSDWCLYALEIQKKNSLQEDEEEWGKSNSQRERKWLRVWERDYPIMQARRAVVLPYVYTYVRVQLVITYYSKLKKPMNLHSLQSLILVVEEKEMEVAILTMTIMN